MATRARRNTAATTEQQGASNEQAQAQGVPPGEAAAGTQTTAATGAAGLEAVPGSGSDNGVGQPGPADNNKDGCDAVVLTPPQGCEALTPLQCFTCFVLALLAERGVLVRRDGGAEEPEEEDLLAITIKGHAITVVTVDGQKHCLTEGEA